MNDDNSQPSAPFEQLRRALEETLGEIRNIKAELNELNTKRESSAATRPQDSSSPSHSEAAAGPADTEYQAEYRDGITPARASAEATAAATSAGGDESSDRLANLKRRLAEQLNQSPVHEVSSLAAGGDEA